ncbi:XAC2610-related protein [Luteimonas lutimaris]|uniref:SH3 domain-containing protein n=1 Tax=Luteimonas lutimaris TaxID=698645 RepID=A0ABP7M6A1_9GAMM|nr:hypothetical protein [Luteimonas sp.]
MTSCYRLAVAILALCGCAPAMAQEAGDDGPESRFVMDIDASTRADIVVGEHNLRVTVHPGEVVQVLDETASDEEGRFHVGRDDFNFDGHVDLSTWAVVGQVNQSVVVYLYDPADRRFHILRTPDNAPVNCEGFWDLTPHAELRLLTSSCRGGPMWFTDVYRFTPQGELYVYRSQRRIMSPLITGMLEFGTDDVPIASVWTTYDGAGNALDTWVGTDPLRPVPLMLTMAEPLGIRDMPGGFLLPVQLAAGEQVEVLDVSQEENWMKVRIAGPAKRPAITGWVAVPGEGASP